jgi:hypothetical protein
MASKTASKRNTAQPVKKSAARRAVPARRHASRVKEQAVLVVQPELEFGSGPVDVSDLLASADALAAAVADLPVGDIDVDVAGLDMLGADDGELSGPDDIVEVLHADVAELEVIEGVDVLEDGVDEPVHVFELVAAFDPVVVVEVPADEELSDDFDDLDTDMVPVAPRQAHEFLCTSCFLVVSKYRASATADVCLDCA